MDVRENMIQLGKKVRAETPLVHNITNYVTVNDCANAILAIGGSPIMADDIREVCEITAIAKALVINMGTLNERTIESMVAAGKTANELGIPVIFDPVGAGASSFRNETARKIIDNVRISVIRGNLSEISYIAGFEASTKGVDTEENASQDSETVAKEASQKLHSTVAITGKVDVITDGTRVGKIHNGTAKMSKVTGTGCMTSAILGAYHGCTGDSFLAAMCAVTSMGIAGEAAWRDYGARGMGSFHVGILDNLSKMGEEMLKEMAEIELF